MSGLDTVDPTVVRGMVDDLNDQFEDAQADLTERQQRVFAQRFVRSAIEAYEQVRLTDRLPRLDGDGQAALLRAVLDMAFQGGELWRVWRANSDALNMWVYGAEQVRIERPNGTIEALAPVARTDSELREMVLGLRAATGRPDARWDPSRPELELIFKDGTRITAIDFNCDHPFVTFRRPTLSAVCLEDLIVNGTMSGDCAGFLKACVDSGQRILIAGNMNAGKTVLLRALAAALRPDAAVMTAETQPELRIDKFPETYPGFVVPLVGRLPNPDGRNGVSVRELITQIQRMSPSVVIVGEVRQGAEAQAFSASLSQGYQVFATIHGRSAVDGVTNAALYYTEYTGTDFATSLARLGRGVDIVVFMDRSPSNQRIVAEVAAVHGAEGKDLDYTLLYNADDDGEARPVAPIPAELARSLSRAGYRPDDPAGSTLELVGSGSGA